MTHLLYTYGYTGGDLADLQAYAAAGAVILDIRFNPWSRNPTWRGLHLERELGGSYEWCNALGNRNYRTGGPIEIVDLAAGLALLARRLSVRPVVLLCACPDPATCHRSVVAHAARSALDGLRVVHLHPGALIPAPQGTTYGYMEGDERW